MKLNFTWKINTAKYQTGESLFLNNIYIASYGWNGSQSRDNRDSNKDWEGSISLPSLKNKYRYGATTEEIKQKIEITVSSWFKEALK